MSLSHSLNLAVCCSGSRQVIDKSEHRGRTWVGCVDRLSLTCWSGRHDAALEQGTTCEAPLLLHRNTKKPALLLNVPILRFLWRGLPNALHGIGAQNEYIRLPIRTAKLPFILPRYDPGVKTYRSRSSLRASSRQGSCSSASPTLPPAFSVRLYEWSSLRRVARARIVPALRSAISGRGQEESGRPCSIPFRDRSG